MQRAGIAVPHEQQIRQASPLPKSTYDIVALASSAGGMIALGVLLGGLPADFPAAIIVVQHLAPTARSVLPQILGQRTPLKVKHAEQGDVLLPSTVYIAPPDYHLVVNADHSLSLSHAAVVHFVRPSADLLFDSAAQVYQDRAIAVVLSGTGLDGAAGVQAIKKAGGIVIAQDAASSQFFGMPDAAIKTGDVDFILPLIEISTMLCTLVMPVVPGESA